MDPREHPLTRSLVRAVMLLAMLAGSLMTAAAAPAADVRQLVQDRRASAILVSDEVDGAALAEAGQASESSLGMGGDAGPAAPPFGALESLSPEAAERPLRPASSTGSPLSLGHGFSARAPPRG